MQSALFLALSLVTLIVCAVANSVGRRNAILEERVRSLEDEIGTMRRLSCNEWGGPVKDYMD